MRGQTRDWLDQPALARLWDGLRDRLERNGLQVRGRLRLEDVGPAEREALGLLLGRPCTGDAVSVPLAELDERLRTGAAERGLVEVVAALRGPLTNRPERRDARRAASARIWAVAEDALGEHGLGDADWPRQWLTEVRRGGALARLEAGRAETLIVQAVRVVALLGAPEARTGRGELAERVTGTAHGLDDDTLLSRLVLRALALRHDREVPRDAVARRELWETAGVDTDQVSGTVLTYGLAPLGDHWAARWLRERSREGAETHLTARDLRRMSWWLSAGTEVHVCENPRVVEAAADAGCTRPLVCVAGNPGSTALVLLDALGAAGARFAYRGDFDWPGVAIAGRMIGRYGARPWRMGAADYEEHVAAARRRGTPLLPLVGNAVAAAWDPELTAAMQALNVAVQEESALELLVEDLR
ncbi:TIGR02679 family protein [Actinomadura hibisca]|uniref:TIGR02679 family protein n=1 Tax=Actinomadura hibisca TaxID=68565 RepID=UPI000A00DCCD|nr:TIGR02679 family protein [Actinomadura hibisca]